MAPLGSCLSGNNVAYKGLSASIRVQWHGWGEVVWCVVGHTWDAGHKHLPKLHVFLYKTRCTWHCKTLHVKCHIERSVVLLTISFTFINTELKIKMSRRQGSRRCYPGNSVKTPSETSEIVVCEKFTYDVVGTCLGLWQCTIDLRKCFAIWTLLANMSCFTDLTFFSMYSLY